MDPVTASALASQAGTLSKQVPPTVDALAPIIHDLAKQNAEQNATMLSLAKEGAVMAKDAASGAASMAERQVNRIGGKEILIGAIVIFIGLQWLTKSLTKPIEDASKNIKDGIASIANAPANVITAAGNAASGALTAAGVAAAGVITPVAGMPATIITASGGAATGIIQTTSSGIATILTAEGNLITGTIGAIANAPGAVVGGVFNAFGDALDDIL